MKKVTTTSHDLLVCIISHLTIVSNVFMRNGTYPWMITGRVYNNMQEIDPNLDQYMF